jgi:NADH-quinone oxidoreductase subunit F
MAGVPKTPAQGAGEQVLWSMLGGAEHLHDIDAYEQAGGYAQLKRALGMAGDDLVAEMKAAGIRGRGGAGFPTGMKMGFIPQVDKPKYLVCNADESEPCTFKDREIMERLPHLLIEGCLIAAWSIGAEAAFIYIRGEYLEPFEVLRDAAEQARERGYIGENVLGSGWSPKLVIHRGAGAYICGEETGLLSSLNGFRGQPTVKPPFPAVSGLYQSPTLVNNVETLASVPRIMAMGGSSFADIGVERTGTGTRVFSLAGHVNRPGNYELTIGVPLSTLIEDFGGGIPGGRALKAVIPGGSSTPILTAEQAGRVLLDYDSMAAEGTMFGSGSVVVIDERTCMAQLALRVAEFYRHESCGKCTPCREGTKWTVDLLTRIVSGAGKPGDVDLVYDVASRIMGRCLCPLGDAMAMPVKSYIERFREDFDRYLEPGFEPPAESPLASIAEYAVEHHEHLKPTVAWSGTLSRADLAGTLADRSAHVKEHA